MAELSDFQSVFEVAAGLHLGVSGLLTLFDDPHRREIQNLVSALKSFKTLQGRYSTRTDLASELAQIKQGIDEAECQLEQARRVSADTRTFTLAKLVSVAIGILSIFYVGYCSDNPDRSVDLGIWLIGMSCAFSPFIIAMSALSPTYVASGSVRRIRIALDKQYDQVVIAIHRNRGSQPG